MTLNHRYGLFAVLCALAAAFVLMAGCGDDDDDDAEGDDDDTGDDDTGDEDDFPDFLAERPELTDWSLWYSAVDADYPVPPRRIGGFGLGNGRAFSMIASRPPFSTMHNFTGPHYQKYLRFFSDLTFTLYRDDRAVQWKRESCHRVRGAAVYVTRQQAGDLSVWCIDVAPRGPAMTELLADRTLVRQIIVHNHGTAPARDLALKVRTVLGRVEGSLIREFITDDNRGLAAGFLSPEAVGNERRALTLVIGDLAPGEERVVRFQIAFAREADPVPVFDTVATLDTDFLLDETLASWRAFTAEAAQIATGNPRFDDLMEGLSVTIATQQAATGGVSEMSEYSGTWLRDIYGPARFYPLIGRFEDYRRMLDYYWLAALENGNIHNSMDLDVEPSGAPEPDWENLPTMSGRDSAESPSYLILHYKSYVDATGDLSPVAERYGMLRHALIHQDMREGCLLPFSDDETFRPAMMVAFGHDVLGQYQDVYLSANSSFLFVVAAEFLEGIARGLGLDDDAAQYDEMARAVRDCTEEYYWLEEGFWAPIIDIETLEPVARPFEDVNTKPVWLGYIEPDDPRAASNLLAMQDHMQREGGLLYSPLDPIYKPLGEVLGIRKGVITGMTYGYQLENLSRMDHPDAEGAFLMYECFFHDTGNVSEGHVVDDFGRMTYLYEPFGFLCDLTARYRTWEGGINGAAMLHYLFGLELDAPGGRVGIAPHLPADWRFARMERARLAETRFDLAVEDEGPVRRVLVEGATGPLTVDAVVSISGEIAGVTVNGEAVEPVVVRQWGRSRALLPGLLADADQPLMIEVTRAAQ